ncbi:MAG: diguanylate cyclase [Pseudomonadota bacterium]
MDEMACIDRWKAFDARDWAGLVLDSLPSAIAMVDADGVIRAANTVWRDLAGGDAACIGQSYLAECHRASRRGCAEALDVAAGLRAVLNGTSSQYMAIYPCMVGGRRLWFQVRIHPLPDQAEGASIIHDDVTAFEERHRRERRLAEIDPLTGLANRRALLERLDLALQAHLVGGRASTLLFVDLDDFKAVNDRLGHRAGDRVLVITALRLLRTVRADDLVARLGGDEFCVLLEGVEDGSRPRQAASEALCKPIWLRDGTVCIDASIGEATLGGANDTAERVLNAADRAMYDAKAAKSAISAPSSVPGRGAHNYQRVQTFAH